MSEPVPADVLRAIAHPLRLALLVALEDHEQAPSELATALDATEPAIAHHLAILHDAGLVTSRRRARPLAHHCLAGRRSPPRCSAYKTARPRVTEFLTESAGCPPNTGAWRRPRYAAASTDACAVGAARNDARDSASGVTIALPAAWARRVWPAEAPWSATKPSVAACSAASRPGVACRKRTSMSAQWSRSMPAVVAAATMWASICSGVPSRAGSATRISVPGVPAGAAAAQAPSSAASSSRPR